jgi:hypothetical protein
MEMKILALGGSFDKLFLISLTAKQIMVMYLKNVLKIEYNK